jgi:hypothetical protein
VDALSLANLMAVVVACSLVSDALCRELSQPTRIKAKQRMIDVFIKCVSSRLTFIQQLPVRLLKSKTEPTRTKRQAREVPNPSPGHFFDHFPSLINTRQIENMIVTEFHVSTFHIGSRFVRHRSYLIDETCFLNLRRKAIKLKPLKLASAKVEGSGTALVVNEKLS